MVKKDSSINLLEKFLKDIFSNLPSLEEQEREVKLMNFKIKSVSGDLLKVVDLNRFGFVNLLWLLGRLDEFLQKHPEIDKEERNFMVDAILNFYQNYNKKNFSLSGSEGFEIELFRNDFLKKFRN